MSAIATQRQQGPFARWGDIVALAACALLGVILAITAANLSTARLEDAARTAQDELKRTVEHVEMGIDRHIQFIEGLHELAALSLIGAQQPNGPRTTIIRDRIALLAKRAKDLVFQVSIVDPDGWVVWSSVNPAATPVWLGDRPHIKAVLLGGEETHISAPAPGRLTSKMSIFHVRTLRDAKQARVGVSVVGVDPDDLLEAEELALHPIPGLRMTYVRRDGTVLAATDPALRGQVTDATAFPNPAGGSDDFVAFIPAAEGEILVRAERSRDAALAAARAQNRTTWTIFGGAWLVTALLTVALIYRNIYAARLRAADLSAAEDARIHALLRDLSANLQDGIALVDKRPDELGKLTFWTDACVDILGADFAQVQAKSLYGLPLPEAARDTVRAALDASRESGASWSGDFPYDHPTKGHRTLEVALRTARRSETGRDFDRTLISVRDVTEQRRAAAELERSATRLRNLLGGMPGRVMEFVLTPTPDGSFLFSDAFVAGLGGPAFIQTAEENAATLNSNTWFNFFEESECRTMISGLRHTIVDGAAIIEYSFLRDGVRHSFRASTRCVRRWEDKALICSYVWDISQEQAMLESLARSTSLISLGEMAAGIMHELNQPLTVISLLATNAINNLATSPPNVEAARNKLVRLLEQTMRGAEIVKYVRKLGRPDDDGVEPIDIAEAVREAVSFLHTRLRIAGVEVELDIADDLGHVSGQTVGFQQVLINLTSNSIDAFEMKPDAGRVRGHRAVTISAKRAGAIVEIVHRDTAGGIPDDSIGKVFNPFFTTKDVGKGTGLGLSLAHRTILGMRGSIDVINRHDGACFTIRLPASCPIAVPA